MHKCTYLSFKIIFVLCCHTVTSSEELLLSIPNGRDIAPLNWIWLTLKGKAVPSPQRTKEAAVPDDKNMVGKHRKRLICPNLQYTPPVLNRVKVYIIFSSFG